VAVRVGTSPINIASSQASIIQGISPGVDDTFTMQSPVKVVGVSLTIKALIIMPLGTLSKPLLHTFNTVTMAPATASMTYSDGTNTTVLAIASGTLAATIPAAAPKAPAVVLHSNGAQAVTLHGDGTTSVRSIGAAPVDLGFSTDSVTLKFYANGVSTASDVHVQIAGEEVPIVYAGASGYFPGLDEVMVQAPQSLIGRGATTVSLTADGQTANPVHLHIQ
jgi:uncharacterized protein (TIGR03437 family)